MKELLEAMLVELKAIRELIASNTEFDTDEYLAKVRKMNQDMVRQAYEEHVALHHNPQGKRLVS